MPLDFLFADYSFPDARACLRTAAPDLSFGVRANVARPWASPILVPLMSRIKGEDMDDIEGLRVIHQWGAGLEGVDVDAASERGIAVANVPTSLSGGAESVAEWCVMSALVLSRRATELTALIRWGHAWGSPMGRAMHGRSACIIGLGDIGKALAARLATFGMHLIAVSRVADQAAAKTAGCDTAISLDNLEHALAISDYVFLCLPHTPATQHLINAATLAMMRAGSILINPGRGGLVDQEALLAAIDSGHLGGCALDVFTPEPLPKDSPLLRRANILATPHIAGITDGTYGQIANFIVAAHAAVKAGRLPANCVNESRIARHFQP